MRILNIGSINMDLVVTLERMPQVGETLFGDRYCYLPGGKGANQGVAAARLGASVSFLGRVGDDALGRQMVAGFAQDGIDTSLITTDPDAPTGLAVIPVERGGSNRIIVLSGANMRVSAEDVHAAFASGAQYDAVMTGLEVPLDTVYAAHTCAAAAGIPLILDAGPAMRFDLTPLCGIEVISPNETECLAMTGISPDSAETARAAAEAIRAQCRARYVILKLGGRGAYLYDGASRTGTMYPAEAGVDVVDTTAAGDCFTAALTVEYLRSGDMRRAVEYANCAAAVCVSRPGAQPSLPYAREVGGPASI